MDVHGCVNYVRKSPLYNFINDFITWLNIHRLAIPFKSSGKRVSFPAMILMFADPDAILDINSHIFEFHKNHNPAVQHSINYKNVNHQIYIVIYSYPVVI